MYLKNHNQLLRRRKERFENSVTLLVVGRMLLFTFEMSRGVSTSLEVDICTAEPLSGVDVVFLTVAFDADFVGVVGGGSRLRR